MELVTLEIDGDIALIGLNRPQKRNALSDTLIDALASAVDTVSTNCRAAVIYGHGKHFSAGLDLAEHVERDMIDTIEHSRGWHAMFDRIRRGKIPFISALHGGVIGGGLELAAATHVRVADTTAMFALPEGQRGIFVGGSGSVGVARLMGAANMADLMLTGRVLSAEEGHARNLCQYVVEEGAALAKAKELASLAAQNAPLSNFAIINALPRIQDMSHEDGLFVESLIASITSESEDAKQRLRDFLEGRAKKLMPAQGGKR